MPGLPAGLEPGQSARPASAGHDRMRAVAPETLLRTKLYAPLPRRDLVARPRLRARLDRALLPPTRLILVSAPAGFGKTTLVSDWLSALPVAEPLSKAIWLSLDDGDNDPMRFWRYVDAGLQTLDPRLGESIRPALYTPQPPPLKTILPGLINDILVVGAPFVLVLDDYHHIESEAVSEGVSFLIDHLPPMGHLVITTRSDPPLQLARRRAQGTLVELRAADLRFSLEEAAQLINEVMRLGLDPDDVAALEARTEGWIAGLQMAAISLQDVTNPHDFVAAFRGDDRYIADYLLEEVLQHQPVEFQRFLLQTSILDQLSGPLCDAVTGRSDSRAVLNTLERANLFVIPLDNRREWFRYHHLFASLLRQRLLDTESADAIRALKRCAGEWYLGHDQPVAAVEMALAAGDFELAAGFIEQSDVRLFMGSEIASLVKWTQAMPPAVIAARPRLNMMAAWAAHATGHVGLCEQVIQALERAAGVTIDDFLQAPGGSSLSGIRRSALLEGAVIRASMAVNRVDLERAFGLGERVLPLLTAAAAPEPFALNPPERLRSPLLFTLGRAHLFRGELGPAEQYLNQAEAEAQRTANMHILAVALGHLGEIHVLSGHLRQAQATFERALQLAQAYPPRASAFWGMASVGLGMLAYEHNDLDAALAHLRTGLDLGRLLNALECLIPGTVGLARVLEAQGEWAAARSALDDLAEVAGPEAAVQQVVGAGRAALALRHGDLEAAGRWLASFHPDAPGPDRPQWEQEALLATRIWLAQANWTEAQTLLLRLLNEAQAVGEYGRATEAMALLALVHAGQGRSEQAAQTLRQALAVAEPEGYVRIFVDEGTPMRLLLRACRSRGTDLNGPLSDYVDRLLSACDQPPAVMSAQTSVRDLAGRLPVEPLSDRELEVLRLMAEGLSNPDIARRLFLSPNTLKAHAQNIYSKLDVHNRMEAVNKAREIGLLSRE